MIPETILRILYDCNHPELGLPWEMVWNGREQRFELYRKEIVNDLFERELT